MEQVGGYLLRWKKSKGQVYVLWNREGLSLQLSFDFFGRNLEAAGAAAAGWRRLGPQWLKPKGCRQGTVLAIMHCFVSGRRTQSCLCRRRCGGAQSIWFHTARVLSGRRRRLVGRGAGAQSRVENSWMLPLWPQRMFRAHIRCDQ